MSTKLISVYYNGEFLTTIQSLDHLDHLVFELETDNLPVEDMDLSTKGEAHLFGECEE